VTSIGGLEIESGKVESRGKGHTPSMNQGRGKGGWITKPPRQGRKGSGIWKNKFEHQVTATFYMWEKCPAEAKSTTAVMETKRGFKNRSRNPKKRRK